MMTGWLQAQLIWEEDHYHLVSRTDMAVSLFLISISLPLTFIVMYTRQDGQRVRNWMPYGFQTCRDNPALQSYNMDTVSFIILCPLVLPPQNPLGPLQANRNRDHRLDANPHIERIAQTTSMTILHELFHVAYPRDSK